jgi:hypothetical protein
MHVDEDAFPAYLAIEARRAPRRCTGCCAPRRADPRRHPRQAGHALALGLPRSWRGRRPRTGFARRPCARAALVAAHRTLEGPRPAAEHGGVRGRAAAVGAARRPLRAVPATRSGVQPRCRPCHGRPSAGTVVEDPAPLREGQGAVVSIAVAAAGVLVSSAAGAGARPPRSRRLPAAGSSAQVVDRVRLVGALVGPYRLARSGDSRSVASTPGRRRRSRPQLGAHDTVIPRRAVSRASSSAVWVRRARRSALEGLADHHERLRRGRRGGGPQAIPAGRAHSAPARPVVVRTGFIFARLARPRRGSRRPHDRPARAQRLGGTRRPPPGRR